MWPAGALAHISLVHFSILLSLFYKVLTRDPGALDRADADPRFSCIADLVENNQNPQRFCPHCEVKCSHWLCALGNCKLFEKKKRVHIKSCFSDLIVLLIAVPAWLHKALQAVWRVHQRLRPSLPFSQPLRWSEKPQTLPHLHPLHGCCPPSFYCLRDKLPVQQDVSRRSRRVAVAHIAGGGVLGCGYDGHERPDTLLGGVAPDGAVQCCCHGNNHLFQTPWELRTTKVIRATLCGFFGLSLGRTEING